MRALVVKRLNFDSAHFLPNYDGPCAHMHGHRWVLEIGIEGEINKESGMVLDFKILKEITKPLVEYLDHELLNTYIQNPTAENICVYFLDWIKKELPKEVKLAFIKVWESEDSYAEVKGG